MIDRFPETLRRISPYGVYVPVSHYCQWRILDFPRSHLAVYRDRNGPEARELFEVPQEKHFLQGMAHIRDNMLCTPYGARAMLVLGNGELDRGHYLAAFEYFDAAKRYFPDTEVQTLEVALRIAYCRKMLGGKVTIERPKGLERTALTPAGLQAFLRLVEECRAEKPELISQKASPSCITADDCVPMPPTLDPLGIQEPVWSKPKSGGGLTVDTQPVVTDRSVIYRHLNIVYCRSILNGEPRWQNDLGGRVSWESRYKNHKEDILVQDGMVFTPI